MAPPLLCKEIKSFTAKGCRRTSGHSHLARDGWGDPSAWAELGKELV